MTHRTRVALLGAAALVLFPLATPVHAASSCGRTVGLSQLPGGKPLADPIPHIPVNGTAGFYVPGANTLPGGELSIGLGYLGQEAVCQQEDGIFDQNTLFLGIGYALTDRLQLSFQVPYTWYEADKSDFNGSGVDDLSFGLGYRFLDEEGWRPALSVVGFAVAPTASRDEGLGTNEWDAGAVLAASKRIAGPFSAFASAGYQYNGRGGAQVLDQFISGVGVEYAITPHISALAEGTANTNWRKDEDRHSDWIAGMNAGLRFRYGGFLVSVAGRKGFTNDAPDWGVFALVSYQLNVGSPFVARQAAAGPGTGGPGVGAPAAGGGTGCGRRRARSWCPRCGRAGCRGWSAGRRGPGGGAGCGRRRARSWCPRCGRAGCRGWSAGRRGPRGGAGRAARAPVRARRVQGLERRAPGRQGRGRVPPALRGRSPASRRPRCRRRSARCFATSISSSTSTT